MTRKQAAPAPPDSDAPDCHAEALTSVEPRVARRTKSRRALKAQLASVRGKAGRNAARPPALRISRAAYAVLRATVGNLPAETEGMLGGDRDTWQATRFAFETSGRGTSVSYTPDHEHRNRLLEAWNADGVRLLGFAHSHPRGSGSPSAGDRRYAAAILDSIPGLAWLYLAILQSDGDGQPFGLRCWAATRDGELASLTEVGIRVDGAEDRDTAVTRDPALEPELPADFPLVGDRDLVAGLVPAALDLYEVGNGRRWEGDAAAMSRVVQAYDLRRLATARVILVGLGGARAFAVDLARAGVREFVLVDPDVVSATNLATQYAHRDEIGRTKVDVTRDEILAVAPDAVVVPVRAPIEQIDREALALLARAPWRQAVACVAAEPVADLRLVQLQPSITLLCGLSDSFEAQAHLNRLSVDLGLPSLAAQMYRDGVGGEVTLAYPGVTPACHRCMLARRYEAYEAGYRNDVTSAGAPIFATGRVNALTGFVAMALLHHGTDHPRWGGLLARISPRTLIQVRMDPEAGASLGLGVFDRVFGGADQARVLFDEAVWLPQEADPACPDCGGRSGRRAGNDGIGPSNGVGSEPAMDERGDHVPAQVAGGA